VLNILIMSDFFFDYVRIFIVIFKKKKYLLRVMEFMSHFFHFDFLLFFFFLDEG